MFLFGFREAIRWEDLICFLYLEDLCLYCSSYPRIMHLNFWKRKLVVDYYLNPTSSLRIILNLPFYVIVSYSSAHVPVTSVPGKVQKDQPSQICSYI